MSYRFISSGRRWLRWLPMLLWMALIFTVSHTPAENIPALGGWDLLLKKGSHLVAYAILALLAQWAIGHKGWAGAIAIVYAVSDEYHQTFIPGRNGQLADVLIDSAGALAALLALRFWEMGRAGLAINGRFKYKTAKQ